LSALRAGSGVAALLPGPAARAVAETVGLCAARLPLPAGVAATSGLAVRRSLVASHLSRVCGPGLGRRRLASLVDDAFASYARYWAESLRLPHLRQDVVDAGVRLVGFDALEAAVAAGRGAILALPHLGGWEWGGRYLVGRGYPTAVVVERLEPPEVFEWFASFRRRLGMEIIPVGPDAATACLRHLAEGRVLCLLADRVVGGVPGVEVPMFGAPARLPAGPAALALRSGAPLLPAAVYFGRSCDEHVALVRPPLPALRAGRLREDLAALTARLAGELETLIRAAPTQWHLMSAYWPGDDDLVARARSRRAGSGPAPPGVPGDEVVARAHARHGPGAAGGGGPGAGG